MRARISRFLDWLDEGDNVERLAGWVSLGGVPVVIVLILRFAGVL